MIEDYNRSWKNGGLALETLVDLWN